MTESMLLESVAANARAVCASASRAEVRRESLLVDDLGLDSLDLVSLLMNLQDAHGVEFDLDRVGEIRRVGDVMDLIRLLSRAAA
jgi:acyl carrier protein